jgi:spore germination cell wall hydrolase CwlJ-like protein
MGFCAVRTICVSVCLGAWLQFTALQSVEASDVESEFSLETIERALAIEGVMARSIPLEHIILLTSLRPKDRPKGIGSRYSARWLRSLDAPKRDKQWACLAEALYFEVRGESVKGQFAVAEVILNRVASSKFPSSICRVVNQGTGRKHACQFSYTCDGKLEHIANGAAYDQVGRVARVMMDSGTRPLTQGATYYHTTSVRPSWARRFEHAATIGVHKFYKPFRRFVKK